MHMESSLMFYLFEADLIDAFFEIERTFMLEKKSTLKIFRVKSLRRMNDSLATGASDSIASHCACKTI